MHTKVSRNSHGPTVPLVSKTTWGNRQGFLLASKRFYSFGDIVLIPHLCSQYQPQLWMLGDKNWKLWGLYYPTFSLSGKLEKPRDDGGQRWRSDMAVSKAYKRCWVRRLYSQQGRTPPHPPETEPLEKENQGFNAHKRYSRHLLNLTAK